MKQVLIRLGRVVVEEMPAPMCGPGEALVRTAFSLISAGTEAANLEASVGRPPVSRWIHRTKKIGEVVHLAVDRGLAETRAAVSARLAGPAEVTGYSLAGTVLEVGAEVDDLVPGQRVACAGASCAHHAELVAVPRNLIVPVPGDLEQEHAAFVTLGAIALNGVRQADVRLGEIACVIGLGLVGQLTVALLHAAGSRVVGADLDEQRVARARSLGLEHGAVAGRDEPAATVERLSDGRGADVVLLTAAANSSEPMRQALSLLRRRGRIVVVGAVGMEIDRREFFQKDAELRIACSYGPGRYDPAYEEEGQDYPYDYVRWTENRNMAEFLRLAAAGRVPLERLVDLRFPVERAGEAYALLSAPAPRPLGILLEYPGAAEPPRPPVRRVDVVARRTPAAGVGVAVVGPGNFACGTHLPNLAALAPAAALSAIVGRAPNSAREAARRFAASYATTDLDEVLHDDGVALVMICTRHELHAEQAVRALEAGKAVFLEKPAALDSCGLARLEAAVAKCGRPVTVGFNRRFAPTVSTLKAFLAERRGPLLAQYRVNAGTLPPGHWIYGPRGGGRLIGEACHMIDLLTHLVGSPRVGHTLRPLAGSERRDLALGDNFILTLGYADGSAASLLYTSLAHADIGKERIEIHWDGQSAILDDFRELHLRGEQRIDRTSDKPDKGHRELLARFIDHVRGAASEPIPWSEIVDTSRFVLELDREARGAAREG